MLPCILLIPDAPPTPPSEITYFYLRVLRSLLDLQLMLDQSHLFHCHHLYVP